MEDCIMCLFYRVTEIDFLTDYLCGISNSCCIPFIGTLLLLMPRLAHLASCAAFASRHKAGFLITALAAHMQRQKDWECSTSPTTNQLICTLYYCQDSPWLVTAWRKPSFWRVILAEGWQPRNSRNNCIRRILEVTGNIWSWSLPKTGWNSTQQRWLRGSPCLSPASSQIQTSLCLWFSPQYHHKPSSYLFSEDRARCMNIRQQKTSSRTSIMRQALTSLSWVLATHKSSCKCQQDIEEDRTQSHLCLRAPG